MKLWMTLYAMVWIVLVEFLLAMTPVRPTVLIYLHILLGAAIVCLAFYNFSGIRNTRIAGRVKRISQASFSISVMTAILGAPLVLNAGREWLVPIINTPVYGLILFFHVFISFAIITQAAAVAIAYDMWEDKEFMQETEPGLVPQMPVK